MFLPSKLRLVISFLPVATKDEIIKMIQRDVCAALGLWKDSCDKAVFDYTPEILELLSSSVVCSYVFEYVCMCV